MSSQTHKTRSDKAGPEGVEGGSLPSPSNNSRRRLLLTIMAGALGFVVNGYPLSLFSGATLIFGGIFYLLIASAYGPVYGLVASLMASSRTILVWGHPYALPAFALESLVVGWLARRRSSLLGADLAFWGALGIPLLILIFIFYMGEPPLTGWVIVLKQPFNSLLCVLVVEFLTGLSWAQRFLTPAGQASERRPLRLHLEKGFILVAAVPLVLVGLAYGRIEFERDRREASDHLQGTANTIRRNIDDYLQTHLQAVAALAETIEQTDSTTTADLNRWLERYHKTYDHFLTMLVADSQGRLIGAHPLYSADGQPILSLTTAVVDREYFKRPIATGQPYISDVFLGRGFGQDPIVAISAPWRGQHGNVAGVVEGSLNLALFREFDQERPAGLEMILLDRQDKVIYATPTAPYQTPHSLFGDPLIAAARAADRPFFYNAPDSPQSSRHMVASATTRTGEWQVLVRQPYQEVFQGTQRYYLVSLLAVLLGVVLSFLFARWLSGRMTRPLEQVVGWVRDASFQGNSTRRLLAPETAPAELVELLDDFNGMNVRLSESYRRLHDSLKEREEMNRSLEEARANLEEKVTERTAELEKARRAAEESEKRYHDLVEGIDPIIWEADARTWRIIYMSRRIEPVLGYPVEWWLQENVPWAKVFHPEDQESITAHTRQLLREGKDYEFEHRAVAADGRVVWLHDTVRIVRDEKGRARQLRGATVDVTERKRAEEAWQESQRFIQRVAEVLPNVVYVYDIAAGHNVFTNRNVALSLGYTPDEVQAMGADFMPAIMHPDDWPRFLEQLNRVAALRDGEIAELEYRMRHAGGGWRWFYSRDAVFARGPGQAVRQIIGSATDITERTLTEEALRASEHSFRLLFERNLAGVLRTTLDGRILDCNASFAEMLGYDSREELLSHSAAELYFEAADREKFLARLRRAGALTNFEAQLRRKDGSPIWILENVSLIQDQEAGSPTLLGTIIDITERKQAEAERRRLEELLFQTQKMESIGTLAGGVAHDFNNLLTSILGNAQLALRRVAHDDRLQPFLADIERAANRAAALTQQLLAFSRHERLERKVIDLNDTLGDFLRMLRRIIGEDIEMTLRTAPHLPPVFADPVKVEQVVMNLAVNARDAMPTGGQLIIETHNVALDAAYCREHPWARPGRYAQLVVSDTGSGMDAHTRQRIFEPFFTTKEVGKGTGLGLSVVYGIIQQHDGLIHVYSEEGHGTTFRIYLPVAEKDAPTIIAAMEPAVRGGTETILVAEDEEALRHLAQDILIQLGYRVLLACDGREAVELFAAHCQQVDLVLLDVVMPRLGGKETYERVREMRPDVPVIFTTGYSPEMPQAEMAAKTGAALLWKPYGVNDLGLKVREALDHAPRFGPDRQPVSAG